MKKLLLFILLFAGTARASVLDDFSSPITTDAKYPLLAGATLTLAITLLRYDIDNPLQHKLARDKPLGKFSKMGDYGGQVIPNAIYASGMLLSGWLGDKKEDYKRAEIMTLATIYASTLTTLMKFSIQEPRPDGGKHSFPSGHSTTAFAFASVVGAEHSLAYAIPAYALATLTAVSRMNDNRHYLRDVVGGATIGISYGLGLYYLRKNKAIAAQQKLQFIAVPAENWKGGTFLASMRF